jgi:hypothetical protein
MMQSAANRSAKSASAKAAAASAVERIASPFPIPVRSAHSVHSGPHKIFPIGTAATSTPICHAVIPNPCR